MHCIKSQSHLPGIADDLAGNIYFIYDFLQRIIRYCARRQDDGIRGNFFYLAVCLYINTGCRDLQGFGGGFGSNTVPVQILKNSPAGGFTDVAAHLVDHLDNNDFFGTLNGHPVKVFGILSTVD